MNRFTLILSLLLIGLTFSCSPKKGTVEGKSAVKQDSIDVTEGVGEGPVGEGDHK